DAELAHPVAVISDAFWRAGFGGDPSIVGKTIRINGASFEVIGVAPAGFRGTFNAHVIDLWVPVTMQQIARPRGLALDRPGWGWLSMIGRLEGGRSIADATRELGVVAADLDRRFPLRNKRAFTVTPAAAVAEHDRRNLQPVLVATFAFTALLFVVTCANLTGIMQSRLAARSLELAIRRSLGAGRVRLAWEWMTECVLIALAGGALGVVAARLTAGAIARMNLPTELLGDASFAVPIGPRVVLYALGLSLVAGVLFGAWPAWRASRLAAAVPLKHDSGSTIGGRHRAASRRLLVAVQMALSVVLLVAASLLVTSVGRQQAFDPGFPTDGLAMLTVNLQRQRVEPGSQRALADRALDVVRRQPGVRDADLGFRTPLSFGQDTLGFTIPGYVAGDGRPSVSIDFNAVGARYFETMGMRFVSGGAWDASAAATTIHAVVNETAARTYFGGADPAGRTIELRGEGPVTIAGVVRDTSYYEIGEAPLPYIYLSAESRLPSPFTIHVRLDDPARAGEVLPRLATALGSADARLSPYDVMTFDELRRVPLFPARMLAGAAGGFGLLALVLTAIGLYGVVSASVAQRTREIGLRLALGARPATVLKGILIEAGWLTLAGAAVGFAGGYLAATSLRSWLFTVSPFDAGAYAAVAVLLAGITLFAAWWPARRAAGIDPISALREG
ncbi:MAG TPA: FtsX-like permease family protein, partial [Vicinamibacterales bacterium]|nr:FtsX-like permease family protein [Vicinamibacterales bacterium]